MIAISSYKPLDDCPEVARNQLRANQSWQGVFSGIVYFGSPDHRLHGQFIPSEQWPRMSLLVGASMLADDPAALINADIVVTGALRWAVQRAFEQGAGAVTSRRYEFIGEDVDDAKIVDTGVDIFVAWPHVWRQVYKRIPTDLRLGHGLWDQWMLGIFDHLLGRKFMDITKARCVFHPRHGNRHPPHEIHVPQEAFLGQCGLPAAMW